MLQDSLALLDHWAEQPVSHWLRLCDVSVGEMHAWDAWLRALSRSDRAPASWFDRWLVHDGVETAWCLARRDVRIRPKAADHARQVLEHLAVLMLIGERVPTLADTALQRSAAC